MYQLHKLYSQKKCLRCIKSIENFYEIKMKDLHLKESVNKNNCKFFFVLTPTNNEKIIEFWV